jgi:hypothetical protein
MKELIEDIFARVNDKSTAICITTNGMIKKDGKLVMGAGVARLAKDRFIGCDEVLGALVKVRGNIVQQFWNNPCLVSFPTKGNWQDLSTLNRIEQSTIQLLEWSNRNPVYKTIILPQPGTMNGGLQWQDVRPILTKVLTDDKFIVINKE